MMTMNRALLIVVAAIAKAKEIGQPMNRLGSIDIAINPLQSL
jgi:hypothetical protein